MLARIVSRTHFEADADVARYIADMLGELKQITDAAGCANIGALLTMVQREAQESERLTPAKARYVSELLMQLRNLAERHGGAQLASLLDAAHHEASRYAEQLDAPVADGCQTSPRDCEHP